MRHIAAIVPAVVLVIFAGCGAREDEIVPKFSQGETLALRVPASKPNAPAVLPKTEWKLLSGLALLRSSIDISSDRKLAVVWGERMLGNKARKSCWLIDLQTAEIEDLLTKSDRKVAAIVRDPGHASFSPDGRHLLVAARDGETACILDLSTGNTAVIERLQRCDVLWIGSRLLFSSWRKRPKVYDVSGELREQPKVRGHIIASDPTGTKLLSWYPDLAAVDAEGRVLREFGGHACDKDMPLLSRSGNWAGVFCKVEDEWAYSVVSTTTDEVLRLRRAWGATLALTDNGDSIFAVGEKNSTFGAVMSGGQLVEATTADIVFWPKGDDPWKSTEGAPEGPSFNDILWNDMPIGKSQIVAKKAMAVTLLGKELFFVQADDDERSLKAIPLPETHVSPPTSESRNSEEKR